MAEAFIDKISIIIPVRKIEPYLEPILKRLENFGFEVIVVSEGSRAKSMNAGAERASKPFLWFIHADTNIEASHIEKACKTLQKAPNGLYYFDLKFDGEGAITLNAIGANLRSRWLKWPYGDQTFILSKENFDRIGRYDENVPYGEDLILVRQAKKHGLPILPIKAYITTSARKYQNEGWLKTTLNHQIMLYKLLRWKI